MDLGFNDYGTFLKKRFNGRVQKISVDGGFDCPNRDGTLGIGGCSYCTIESIKHSHSYEPIFRQLQKGIAVFEKRQRNNGYLAYFQYFTNTFSSLKNLKKLYEKALKHPKIEGLVISTRPDCLSEEVLDLLERFAEKHFIALEIGVESCNDEALSYINRCHTFREAEEAILRASKRNLHLGVHLILGLPYDSFEQSVKNAVTVSKLPINNIKFHHLQILKGTKMAEQFQANPTVFRLFTKEQYFKLIISIIRNIHPDIYIQRFISRAPEDLLIAPRWDGIKNFEFTHWISRYLKENNITQGQDFKVHA